MKPWMHRTVIVLFFTACLIPASTTLMLGAESSAANETLSPKPKLHKPDGGLNLAYLEELANYYGDRFVPRHAMVTAYSALQAGVFRTSAMEDVILGRDGWLFYREELDDYLNIAPLTDRQAWAAAHTLAMMQDYAEARGADFLFTIAPNKSSLYPQYLPETGKPLEGETNLQKITAYLTAEGVAYADLFTPFRELSEVLYQRLDSHWTAKGAALAHDKLLSVLGRTGGIAFSNEFVSVSNRVGDLYQMLYPTGKELDTDMVPVQEPIYTAVNPVRSPEAQNILTSSEQGTGSLLMFRDSFGNALYPYLAHSFASARFSRSMPYRMDWLNGEDTVIVELVERNLEWLAERPPVMAAPVRELGALPEPGDSLSPSIVWEETSLLKDMIMVTGTVGGAVDTNSPIYLLLNEAAYEAFLVGEDRFSLYVPRLPGLDETASILIRRNNTLIRSPLTALMNPDTIKETR